MIINLCNFARWCNFAQVFRIVLSDVLHEQRRVLSVGVIFATRGEERQIAKIIVASRTQHSESVSRPTSASNATEL